MSSHEGLSASLSVIWWRGDTLLLSAWHLEPRGPSNESGMSLFPAAAFRSNVFFQLRWNSTRTKKSALII